MKNNLLLQFIVCLLFVSGCVPRKSRQDENPPREVTLVVSPFLPGDPQTQTLQLAAWATRQANCRFRVYNGWDGLEVTSFTSPHMDYYKEDAAMRRIGAPLQKWMAWSRDKSSNTNLSGSGAVSIAKVLALLAQEHSSPENLVIIGSPVARFPNATNYDFAQPFFRFPSDGQITGDKTSPFFSEAMAHSMAGTKVFYFYPRIDASAWPLGYERSLHHFFGLFFASRAGNLVAFTPDLDAGLKLINSSSKVPFNDFKAETAGIVGMLDARDNAGSIQTNIAAQPIRSAAIKTHKTPTDSSNPTGSNRASQTVFTRPAPKDLKTNTKLVDFSVTAKALTSTTSNVAPPSLPVPAAPLTNVSVIQAPIVGVTIQLRYSGKLNADVDLYVRPHGDADEVSFRKEKTALAQYEYLYDFETGEHVKSVHLPAGCDAEKATAWVNYRNGFGLVSGQISWVSPAGQRDARFSFMSLRGGDADSRRDAFRRKSDCWQQINLLDLITGSSTAKKEVSSGRPNRSDLGTAGGRKASDVNDLPRKF